MERPSDDEIERAIVRYFQDHPHAMDTLVGIADWWLNGRGRRIDRTVLANVLLRLVERGVIEQVGSGPSARYRVRRPAPDEN